MYSSLYYTGTPLHADPGFTDAFNTIFAGHKWWVALPKDIYENEYFCLQVYNLFAPLFSIFSLCISLITWLIRLPCARAKVQEAFVLDRDPNSLVELHILYRI